MKDNDQTTQRKQSKSSADHVEGNEGSASLSSAGYNLDALPPNPPPIQRKKNNTGMSDSVKEKMEGAFGEDLSDVKIHTDSGDATKHGALAYTQGEDIHFAPGKFNENSKGGQELLGHELTHVIQQKQQRVNPNTSSYGVPVNNEKGLEAEADTMGSKAAQFSKTESQEPLQKKELQSNIIQMYPDPEAEGQFWELLRGNAVDSFHNTLHINSMAINQFETDMDAQENPDHSMQTDLIDFAMDIAGASPQTKLAYKLFQNVYTRLNEQRSGSITLAAFSREVRAAQNQVVHSIPQDWSLVNENSPAVFQEIARIKSQQGNETVSRRRAIEVLSGLDSNLPNYNVVLRKFVQAWIGSAEDRTGDGIWDNGDPIEGLESGYLRIHANIDVNLRGDYISHRFTQLNFDDIDLPDGTKQALISGWGENAVLDELPFPGYILLTMGRISVRYTKTNKSATDELEGWDVEGLPYYTQGFQEHFPSQGMIDKIKRLYMTQIRPSVRHLTND